MALGFWTGLTALRAFANKMQVISSNMANCQTSGYRAKRAVMKETHDGGVQVEIELQNKQINREKEEISTQQSQASDIEITREIPQAIITKRGFQANLKTLQTEDEMLGTLIDIFE